MFASRLAEGYRNFVETIRSMVSLDICDLNYGFSCEAIGRLENVGAIPKEGYLLRFGNYFYKMAKFLNVHMRQEKVRIPKGVILFFAGTKNQKDSLIPISEKIPNFWIVSNDPDVQASSMFPLFIAYLAALPFLPLILWRLLKEHGYKRKSFRYNFDYYWLTYGYYVVALYWLRKISPRIVITSNDHNMPNRVMTLAARINKIPTVYVQHASVNKRFPALNFDYAFLDGQNALKVYDKVGKSNTKVFLIGTPKFDFFYKHINRNLTLRTLGICTNHFDPIEKVDVICKQISERLPDINVMLRPHPGDVGRKEAWEKLAEKYSISFSNPKEELSFEFLKRCDAVIVGDSNILLEAALLNVYPLYYDFNSMKWDWYGFLANGLTEYHANPDEISKKIQELIQRKPDVRQRCRTYCCTVEGRYDGHSSDLAALIIKALADGKTDFMHEWQRIPDVFLEAYELNN